MNRTLLKNKIAHRGLTLLEIVVATMVMGVMLVAALEAVGAVFKTNRLNADRLTGPSLAHELMAEIMSMSYKDKDDDANENSLGTDADESTANRALFDDVDDYDGFNKLGISSKVGIPRPSWSGWRSQVSVRWIEVLTGDNDADNDTGLKRIAVRVTSPSGEITELFAYRYQEGMLEQAPDEELTVVHWVGVELQLGPDSSPARLGTNLINHATDAD